MVQINGTYQSVSSENYKEYLESLGVKGEVQEKLLNANPPLVISGAAANQVTVSYLGKQVTYPFNKEVEHELTGDHKAWTTASQNGDVITFKSKLTPDGSVTEQKVLTFTDSGVTSVSTNSKGGKYVRTFKRA